MRLILRLSTTVVVGFLLLGVVAYAACFFNVTRSKAMPELHGLSLEETTRRLGASSGVLDYRMGEAGGEFRCALLNHYPLDVPGNMNIAIKEVTWNQGCFKLTLWFHRVDNEWRVVESLKWHKDVVF